ncbi:putative RNA recognition motif domain, nucleotide-binding alpha-beta plait domain superfamily [Helianthus annuus]|nr:putative RNA recognition motif domain, nucleotide-binding alpha-beta plait domain superfamily [Helianthus annuus]KAJ0736710.1 putative RNA recognition motif domain, nucleotide-binding alpha-beta plait domain superfamily [Helianthus annuus]KAJ0914034.1 putative RNA recognition motif domain, nucleotide-binding alpha-beta plait domain superfamily [Helianthus annuus]
MEGGPSHPGRLGGITKFFITNLPEGCTPWELKCGLVGLGDVWGTYVAKKRDKEGRRFGFASFKDVRDKSELERSLKGLKLGGCKLVVNIARFAKENGGGGALGGPPKDPELSKHHPFPQGTARTFNYRDARSYSEVLGKGKGEESGLGGGNSSSVSSNVGRKSIVIPDRSTAFKELWRRAVVARTVDLETLVDLDQLLRIAKTEVDMIQYLGGLSVLISFREEGLASIFLESKDLWGPWFTKVAMWEGQSLPFERVAWLRFLGVPLHLVDPEVLRTIGESFGKFLHVQKSFGEDRDLSVVRVGVLVGDVERIKEFISVKWKNRSFRIWVEEELDVWVPDCLKGVDGESPATSSPMMSPQFGDQAVPGKHGEGEVEVDQSPDVSVHEEVREVASEVGGEKSSPAVLVDTCMGGAKGINDMVGTEVGQGRNIFDQASSPTGNSLYRFSSVGPSKIRRRPRSSLSHRPNIRAQVSPISSVEPRPKKRATGGRWHSR